MHFFKICASTLLYFHKNGILFFTSISIFFYYCYFWNYIFAHDLFMTEEQPYQVHKLHIVIHRKGVKIWICSLIFGSVFCLIFCSLVPIYLSRYVCSNASTAYAQTNFRLYFVYFNKYLYNYYLIHGTF